ncbi:ADP-ribosylglycohydrolase family protein [Anatilimnocola floriformis]|uniref:ADP-ribosylglycohydrolase family protein n=1 Tax=Anatilimnocola floriformis TaxID=2948575 RepID=UPI0020C2DE35|nr:ADP-ribosylglycohydrolase family protein [Anatilimnocola floriformis]
MTFTASLSQFQGCLLGAATADALGAPWEGLTAELIFEMGPADRIVQHESGETIYYTDDTQMTMGIVETLVKCGAVDGDVLADRFVANYHPDRGYGQGARALINEIAAGADWRVAAAAMFGGQGSLGNGAAMRVAPIGVYFAADLTQVTKQAERSAEVTHQHPIGIDSARLLAVAAALATRSAGKTFDRTFFLQQLRDVALTEEFQWQIDLALQLEPFQSLRSFGNSLEAHRSVMTSIMCFADSPNNYEQAISRAIGRGDDVDTLAEMTGGLVGARLGLEGVPQRLWGCLEEHSQGRSYLLSLGEQLWKLRTTQPA